MFIHLKYHHRFTALLVPLLTVAQSWSSIAIARAATPSCDVIDAAGYASCVGDCDGGRTVSVDEIIATIGISLGTQIVDACGAGDPSRDGTVTVDEIVRGVDAALKGCPAARPLQYPTCAPGTGLCSVAAIAGIDDLAFGKGAAFVDVDGDGWDDIWASDSAETDLPSIPNTSALYLNQRDGTFAPYPLGARPSDLSRSWAASFADWDNDGDPDVLFVSGGYAGEGVLSLYRNDLTASGEFTRLQAGLTDELHDWWGASWADYDGDGWLDFAATTTQGRVWLYHNRGDGTFEEVAEALGLDFTSEDGKNPVWIDYDLDGDPDLYLAGQFPAFFTNEDGLRFAESNAANIGDVRVTPYVFSAAADDFDQDGWPDLYLGRWVLQDLVLINQRDGSFRAYGADAGIDAIVGDVNSPAGLSDPNWRENTMGLGVGDFTGDGLPDLLIGTGNPLHQFPDIAFCNTSVVDTTTPVFFERCSEPFVRGHGAAQTHGIALGDVDNDGLVDLFFNLGGMRRHMDMPLMESARTEHALYVQRPAVRPNTATVRLVGTHGNRDAIGARIRVDGEESRYYTKRSTQGFQSQNSSWMMLALGARKTGLATITWPGGGTCTARLRTGDRIIVTEVADP